LTEPSTPLQRAKALALRYLATCARTETQVRARLAKAELADVADEVVGWLRALGYLDDAAYARARARSLVAHGRAGPRLAERRLQAAGIPASNARAAVAGALEEVAASGGEPAEVALCRALLLRKLRGADPGGLDDRDRRRLSRFLLGRGFSGSVVSRVLGVWADFDG
jgi:regulatory protein